MKTVFIVTVEHEEKHDLQIDGNDVPDGGEAEGFEWWLQAAEAFGHREGVTFSVELGEEDQVGDELEQEAWSVLETPLGHWHVVADGEIVVSANTCALRDGESLARRIASLHNADLEERA